MTRLAYDVVGDGMPLIALHGAYSTRAEVRGYAERMLETHPLKRIYVDLPGHGGSRPSVDVRSPDAALDLFDDVLATEALDGPFALLGHSFGGHFARALAARHPDRTAGLALICPVTTGEFEAEPARVVRDDGVSAELEGELRRAYEGYFTVRTAETLARFRADVVPSLVEVDEETLDTAITTGPLAADPDTVDLEAPVIVLTGRQDSVVGWRRQQELLEVYPRATSVVVADAGHALPHEHPHLVAALLEDWLRTIG